MAIFTEDHAIIRSDNKVPRLISAWHLAAVVQCYPVPLGLADHVAITSDHCHAVCSMEFCSTSRDQVPFMAADPATANPAKPTTELHAPALGK